MVLQRGNDIRNVCFDLMKGICIILVIVDHCGGILGARTYVGSEKLYAMLEHLYIPLFFFVAGYFYKEYSCFIHFLIKKFNSLIVPLIFFAALYVFWGCWNGYIEISVYTFIKHLIGNVFIWTNILWFLKTLFLSLVIFYALNKLIKKFILVGIVTVSIGFIAYLIKKEFALENLIVTEFYNNLISALIVQPLLYGGKIFKNIVEHIQLNRQIILLSLILFSIIWYLSSFGGVFLVFARVDNNIMLFYLASFSAILSVWSFCQLLTDYVFKYFKSVEFLGRYSIVVYGTHIFCVLFCLKYMNPYWSLLVVLSLMPVMIWIFKNVFPMFVAQRDLLVYERGRIKVDYRAFSLKNK